MQHRIELQLAGPDRSQLRTGCRQRHADERIPPAAVTQAGGAVVDAGTVTGAHTKGIAVRLPLARPLDHASADRGPAAPFGSTIASPGFPGSRRSTDARSAALVEAHDRDEAVSSAGTLSK